MSRAARWTWVGLVLPLFGCVLPWAHSRREEHHVPQAVQRFAEKAQALGYAQGAPSLSEVTFAMSAAIEALPQVKGGDELGRAVSQQAGAMTQQSQAVDALARSSLDTALDAVERAQSIAASKERDRAIGVAKQAVEEIEPGQAMTLHAAYREIARAMLVVAGGRGTPTGSELAQLVTRFTIEEPDDARRTGAQAIAAMGDALQKRAPEHAGRIAKELRERAERLATAPSLEYAGQLKEALSLVLRALEHIAEGRSLDEARTAIDAIREDRPLALQHAAAAVALRLVADALSRR